MDDGCGSFLHTGDGGGGGCAEVCGGYAAVLDCNDGGETLYISHVQRWMVVSVGYVSLYSPYTGMYFTTCITSLLYLSAQV